MKGERDSQPPTTPEAIATITAQLLDRYGDFSHPVSRILGIEAINGAGKSTATWNLYNWVIGYWTTHNHKSVVSSDDRYVLMMKASGSNPVDTARCLCMATQYNVSKSARVFGDMTKTDLYSIFLPIISAQEKWQKGHKITDALEMLEAQWRGVNTVLQRFPETSVLLDRTPVSALLAIVQRTDPRVIEPWLKGVVARIGKLPVPQSHMYLDIEPELALYRREHREGPLPASELNQMRTERACFEALFAKQPYKGQIWRIDARQEPNRVIRNVLQTYLKLNPRLERMYYPTPPEQVDAIGEPFVIDMYGYLNMA